MVINKVALVTGSNKGIGFAIVQELCKRGVEVVYLASRDLERGKEAVEKLKKEGLAPKLIQLEVTDKESVKAAAEKIKTEHEGLDILISNAALGNKDWLKIDYEEALQIINTNYKSAFNVKEFLYPILNENARVVYINSDCGHLSNLKNKYWINTLKKDDLTNKEVDEFVEWFLTSIRDKKFNPEDFAANFVLPYRVSKIALVALARIHQKEIGKNIAINSIHPGFVKTDMTGGLGFLTTEESAIAPVDLALTVPQSLKGAYLFYDGKERDWTDESQKLYFDDFKSLKK